MNFKRNQFIAITGMTVSTLKNYERSDRSFLPHPEDCEVVDQDSVRRFTPFQVLKFVLMKRLVDTYGMSLGKAFGIIEFAGKELVALSSKIARSDANSPVLLAIHISDDEASNRLPSDGDSEVKRGRGVSIFGGYPDRVLQTLLSHFKDDAAAGSASGPTVILNVTDAVASILKAADYWGIAVELGYATNVGGIADDNQ